jgi:hypothetical protein
VPTSAPLFDVGGTPCAALRLGAAPADLTAIAVPALERPADPKKETSHA